MKKFLLIISLILLGLILSTLLLSKIYEDRLIEAFKEQIIDKTNINIDFEEIHFSIFSSFPYCSFTLNDAKIFYSKHSRKDTLLNCKKLCFKINTINLFRSIYEFPEIIISDGSINLKVDLLDSLLKSDNTKKQKTNYLVETKIIKLNRCSIKYIYKEFINLNLYTNKSSFSGSFLPNSLSFKLNLNINQFFGHLNGFNFNVNDFINLSSTVKQQNETFFSENGKINKGSVELGFSFLYNTKDESLQIKTNTEKISAKIFCKEFLNSINTTLTKGNLSFDSFYSINFKVSKSQKLTFKYHFDNVTFDGIKNFTILNLEGKTTFTNDLKRNDSKIDRYLIHYNGFEITGSSLIKNFPQPSVLADCKITNLGKMNLNEGLSLDGKLKGNIKVLTKIDDVNKLNFKDLKITKIQSELTLENISIKSIPYVKAISGSLKLIDNVLRFKGKGVLFNKAFKGTLDLPEFLEFVQSGKKPIPNLFIEMDKLNLDSALTSMGTNSRDTFKFEFSSKVKSLQYKGFSVADLEINLNSKNGCYNCDYIKFKAFKGTITGGFVYSNLGSNSLSLTGQSIDIQILFKNFKNFGQTIITSKNISGSISGKIDMSYKMKSNDKIDPLSIKLISNIIVEKGKLSGVSQLKRVSKFLNISEIDSFLFNTIQNKIDVENGVIIIPSMDISSNALAFQISGKHGFDGEFTYWIKLNLKEILAKKYFSKKSYGSDYEKDSKSGLNLFLKIYGNNESFNVGFDKKSSVEHIKNNLNQEGQLLKTILKEEFGHSNKNNFLVKDSTSVSDKNIVDSNHNKNQKKPFKIEWDEIDTTKNY